MSEDPDYLKPYALTEDYLRKSGVLTETDEAEPETQITESKDVHGSEEDVQSDDRDESDTDI